MQLRLFKKMGSLCCPQKPFCHRKTLILAETHFFLTTWVAGCFETREQQRGAIFTTYTIRAGQKGDPRTEPITRVANSHLVLALSFFQFLGFFGCDTPRFCFFFSAPFKYMAENNPFSKSTFFFSAVLARFGSQNRMSFTIFLWQGYTNGFHFSASLLPPWKMRKKRELQRHTALLMRFCLAITFPRLCKKTKKSGKTDTPTICKIFLLFLVFFLTFFFHLRLKNTQKSPLGVPTI